MQTFRIFFRTSHLICIADQNIHQGRKIQKDYPGRILPSVFEYYQLYCSHFACSSSLSKPLLCLFLLEQTDNVMDPYPFKEKTKLHQEINEVSRNLEMLELQSRRNNLIVDGLPEKQDGEESWDQWESLLIGKLNEKMEDILNATHIERAHRIGQFRPGNARPRSVIVKFTNFKIKSKVWEKRFSLKRTNIFLEEDFPTKTRDNRRKLIPYWRAARNNHAVKSCKLSLDKLILNGKAYTVETLKNIPSSFQLEVQSIKTSDNAFAFSSKDAIFSNLYPCKINYEGKMYKSAEEAIQISKSLLFDDQDTASKIARETDPYKQMQMGRQVQNFQKDIWQKKSREL